VLGDTEHSEDILHTMSPVRDMFAALFFVSIGMLVDLSLVADFIGPALIISAVFIFGNVIANTLGTFIAGNDSRTALRVGMGMPQIGEFSLAMVKVGAEHGAVGSFLYPVVTVTTAITSLLYPFIFRSADATAAFLERRSPQLLRQYLTNLSIWLITLRSAFSLRSEIARRIQHSGRVIFLNLGIIVVLITVGTFVLRYTAELSGLIRLREGFLGLIIGLAAIALCVPSGMALWRELRTLADELTTYLFRRRFVSSRLWRREDLRAILRDSISVAVVIVLGILTIPFVSQLFSLGSFSIPVAIFLLAGMVLLTARAAVKIHRILEATFSRTFLGQSDSQENSDPQEEDTDQQRPH